MDALLLWPKFAEADANAQVYAEAALDEAKDYTDTRIDSIIPGFDYKGSVATIEDLPTEGQTKGDCYNVTTGNLGVYVWDGTAWTSSSKVGPQGAQGTAAGIANAQASVDSATGTPSVTVVTSGPDTAKQFSFEFHNLKGTPGSNTVSVSSTGSSTNQVNYITIDGTESKLPQGTQVSVSDTGTSTNDVRYITIDGAESRFTSVALRAMKSAWITGTTLEAANAILNDDSVVAGDGFLATVYWSDLPGNLTQAEVKAFVMKKSGSYQKIIQFECTSGTVAPYSWFYNSYERVWRSQVPLNDTLTSTSADEALTANMGKSLQDQVNNLKNIGRFLSILDCSAGTVSTQPTGAVGSTYNYKVGDYYRVGADGSYGPKALDTFTIDATSGSSNFETGSETYAVGDVIYCSNVNTTNHTSTWAKQTASGGGTVQDVQINGTTILDSGTGIANIPVASTSGPGVIKYTQGQGLSMAADKSLYVVNAVPAEIEAKTNKRNCITPGYLDKAVMEGLGNNSLTWPDNYKAAARNTIGCVAMAEYDPEAASYAENTLYYVVED